MRRRMSSVTCYLSSHVCPVLVSMLKNLLRSSLSQYLSKKCEIICSIINLSSCFTYLTHILLMMRKPKCTMLPIYLSSVLVPCTEQLGGQIGQILCS